MLIACHPQWSHGPRAGTFWLAALLCFALPACSAWTGERAYRDDVETGFVKKTMYVDSEKVRYRLYVPDAYDAARPWPLIVFLHGAGDRGRDGKAPTKNGIGPAIREHPERFPALVLFPQCPKDVFWDAVIDEVDQAMAETLQDYNVDRDRIYLTGISMGGFGTWLWGAMEADTFAALMPLCGGGSDIPARAKLGMRAGNPFGTFQERVKRWVDMPIWAFHGADDETVPPAQSSRTVDLIKKAGGKHIRYTEYPDTGHNCWDRAYNDPEVIAWLLAQRKDADSEDGG